MEIKKNQPQDYIDVLAAKSNEFTTQGLKAYKLYVKTLGTNVTVTRVKGATAKSTPTEVDAARYHRLLKAAMTVSEDAPKAITEQFQYRMLINKSQLGGRYTKSTIDVRCIVTDDVFLPGDIVSFQYRGLTYRFKVNPEIESFGPQDGLVYAITLNPFRESK